MEKPGKAELVKIFKMKYGELDELNWSPALRWKFSYFNPDDVYEALVEKLVKSDTQWLDVGCGRNIFPSNQKLSAELSGRARLLVGTDPDETIEDNPYVHEKVRSYMDDFSHDVQFDLLTLRMVAEHVASPKTFLAAISRSVAKDGLVVVYTVNKYSPVPLVTNLVPFSLHNPVKKVLWSTEPEDTFPTCFNMNSRKVLKGLFSSHGFTEELFLRLDDCRTFSGIKPLATMELAVQWSLRKLSINYPEYCLLGVYRKQ